MPAAVYIASALLAYLLGSIPTGFLVAKAKGVDIRSVGSGNIGATNVFRFLGKGAGLFVLFADALKGWLGVRAAVWMAQALLAPDSMERGTVWAEIIAGFMAIIGHNYTCWLYFRGGKGIATSAGVLTALVPIPLLIILGVWIVVFALSRYVSLASISAAFVLPFATWIFAQRAELIIATAAMTTLAIYKHKANIQRLIAGTENRIGFKKTPQAAKPTQ